MTDRLVFVAAAWLAANVTLFAWVVVRAIYQAQRQEER